MLTLGLRPGGWKSAVGAKPPCGTDRRRAHSGPVASRCDCRESQTAQRLAAVCVQS